MATINGTAQDVTRGYFGGAIKFENLDFPLADGSRITCAGLTEVIPNSSTGAFSLSLAPGRYKIWASGKSRVFTVPTGSSTYDISDLLAAAAETALPWLKQADTLTSLRAIPSSTNLRLAYVLADGNGFEAFYRHTTTPPTDDGNGNILSDDGNGGWIRSQII